MTRLIRVLGLLMLSVLLLAACDKSSTEPEENNTVNGDFAVTVGSGTTPQYSWNAGNAFSVSAYAQQHQPQLFGELPHPDKATSLHRQLMAQYPQVLCPRLLEQWNLR